MTPAPAVEGVAAEFTLAIGPVLVAAITTIAQAAGVGAIAVSWQSRLFWCGASHRCMSHLCR